LLMLSTYMRGTNASPVMMASIQDEFTTCQELASKSPYAESNQDYCWFLGDILSIYSPNATATAEMVTMSTQDAQQTLDAAVVLVPSITPSPEATRTVAPAPTITNMPQATATPVQAASSGQNLLVLAAAAIVAIILAGYLLSKRSKGGSS